MLVVFGEKDKHVTIEKNRAPLLHAMAHSMTRDFTVKTIADADHVYTTFGLNQEWKVLPEFLNFMASWIQVRVENTHSGDVTTDEGSTLPIHPVK